MEEIYRSLYRKYRPQNFAQIMGQRHVSQTLERAVQAGRIAHAYLFCGPRGTGKTTTARVLALALNCVNGPTPAPCGECAACQSIRVGSSFDVVEIDAASNRGIDDIRELRDRVKYAPAENRYKVYVIDEVHMLTSEAFNALLKTLEEPPPRVIFVLCTTEPHRLPPTILSRCQRFDFRRAGVADLTTLLQSVSASEGLTIAAPAIALLARAADGSNRDGLSLLDQTIAYAGNEITVDDVQAILGGIDIVLLERLSELMLAQDLDGLFHLVDQIVAEGKDLRQLVSELTEHWRNLLVVKVCREGDGECLLGPELRERLGAAARSVSQEQILRTVAMLGETEREMRQVARQRLALELCMVRICLDARVAAEEPPAPRSRPAERAPSRPTAASAPAAPKPVAAEPRVKREADTSSPAAPNTAAPSAGSDATVIEIREAWDAIIARLRDQRHVALTAFLREAHPLTLEKGVLTLGFNHEFHCDQMKSDERRSLVATAIAEETGATVRILCEFTPDAGRGEGASGRGRAKTSKVVDEALSAFPGSEIL